MTAELFAHTSVMRDEVLATLAPAPDEVFVDCTLGAGGHAGALLAAAPCRVVGIDRDAEAVAAAAAALEPYGDRFQAFHARFSELGDVLDRARVAKVHGILADLGVSSPQLDHADRGFSFRAPGPIDMRMDRSAPLSAQQIVDTWPEAQLADVVRDYGEERQARRVARAIVAGRPWRDTVSLAAAIAAAVGPSGKAKRIHPATRTFQALRIAVNDELGEVERLLPLAVDRLLPGGRLAILTFHSLEDRLVKQFLDGASGKRRPKDAYGNPIGPASVRLLPDLGSDEPDNPRARSARLRRAVRLP